MSTPDLAPASAHQLVRDAVHSPDFRRATFAGTPRNSTDCIWVRVAIRPVVVRGEQLIQFSYFDRKKNITKNFRVAELEGPLTEVLAVGFAGIHVATGTKEVDIRTTKKGKVLIGRRRAESTGAAGDEQHNRIKDLPLPEGRADRVLEVMGILTADGRVRPTMRAKFTQINEFLKHLIHALDNADLRSAGRPLDILDCGCGSSYLTLAAYHFLNDQLGIPARILGVDVNEEVIRKSTARAGSLDASGLSFACGRIGMFDARPDIVLALHACDTATDDAIAHAVTTGAKLLLSAPCCHHHLNRQVRSVGPAAVLAPVLRHGILRERAADLATDAFAPLALRIMGYRVDVVEFVSPEHTARNLLIRAAAEPPAGERTFVNEYRAMRVLGRDPYIETALGDPFCQLISDA